MMETCFSLTRCTDEKQCKIIAVLSRIIGNNISANNLLDLIREPVEPQLFVLEAVQENYDIYHTLRTELVKKGTDVV